MAQVSGSFLVGDAWAQEWITRFLEVSSALHSMKWSDQHCLKQYPLEIKTRTCYQNSMSDVSMSWQSIMPHIHFAFASTQFPQKSTKTASTNRRHSKSITLQHYLLKKTWNLPQSDPFNVFDKGIVWMLHILCCWWLLFFSAGHEDVCEDVCCSMGMGKEFATAVAMTSFADKPCLRFRSARIWIQ